MSPMEYLEKLSGMTPEEFNEHCDAMGFAKLDIPQYCESVDLELDMHDNLTAIFRGTGTSGSSGNTTNGGQLTWTWPVGAGNTVSPNTSATPAATQTLYRRNTHDENGDAKQFTKEQEQLWHTFSAVATMTNAHIWKTAEEIHRDAEGYQKRIRASGIYISLANVEETLGILCLNGMVEKKDA